MDPLGIIKWNIFKRQPIPAHFSCPEEFFCQDGMESRIPSAGEGIFRRKKKEENKKDHARQERESLYGRKPLECKYFFLPEIPAENQIRRPCGKRKIKEIFSQKSPSNKEQYISGTRKKSKAASHTESQLTSIIIYSSPAEGQRSKNH